MKSGMRILLTIVGAAIGLVLIAGLFLLFNYPAEYLRRLIILGVSDTNDYLVFPERAIAASAQPIPFKPSEEPDGAAAQIESAFKQVDQVGDLNTFLERTETLDLIIIKNETIHYEKYLKGKQRDSIVTSFSSAKSFVSTLVGIAIEEGKIHSIDDPITKYLPELAARDNRFENITIRNLLDMNSGIKYIENGFITGDDALTYYYPDLHELALEKTSIASQPGQTWLYNNYHPLLLGIILERATGKSVGAYLEQKLWQPIGAEYPASWSLDSDETAFEKMESGINARAIDFAKLGRLFLNHGSVNGAQILPTDWVSLATRMDVAVNRKTYYPPDMEEPNAHFYHQRLWWGIQRDSGDYGFAALGNFGQIIFVYPPKELIIVRHGESYGGLTPQEWFKLFMNFAELY